MVQRKARREDNDRTSGRENRQLLTSSTAKLEKVNVFELM